MSVTKEIEEQLLEKDRNGKYVNYLDYDGKVKRYEDEKSEKACQTLGGLRVGECKTDIKTRELEQITEEALKGGFKADKGKPRVDLIPPEVLLELGKLYAMGAEKYAPNNWRLGMEFWRVYRAMQAHTYKWWAGEEFDPDGQHHLDSVIWNAIALRYYMLHYEKYKEFDSRKEVPVRAVEGDQK